MSSLPGTPGRLWILVALAMCPGLHGSAEDFDVTNPYATIFDEEGLGEGMPGPETNAQDSAWLDRANDTVFNTLEQGVDWVDSRLGQVSSTEPRIKNSTFRVKLHMRVEEHGGPQVSIEPDAAADLYMPRLSQRLRLHLRSTSIDELPGVDPTQEDTSWLLGVARTMTRKFAGDVTWGLGLKLRPNPEPYTSLGSRRTFEFDDWYLTPIQRFFWRRDEGFGEMSILVLERLLGPRSGAISTSAAKWTEETEGVEWEQSLMLAFLPGGYVRTRQSREHMFGLKGSVFGHKSGEGIVDLYRVQCGWRRPLRRQWLYLDVVPGVDFEREQRWDEVLWIRIGLEIFFDGSAMRSKSTPAGVANVQAFENNMPGDPVP